jgi:hypothetical protein
MYHGLGEIWAGFSKNLFHAFSRNLLLLLGVLLMIVCGLILPLFFALWGWAYGRPWAWIPGASYCALTCVRLGLTLRFGRDSYAYAFLNPLAWSVVVAIALNSAYRSLSGGGTEWKGRIYNQGRTRG